MPYTDIADFRAHLAGGTKTLAVCWRIVRKDGEIFAFTSHMLPLSLPEITVGAITVPATDYVPGCTPGELKETDDLVSDEFGVEGALDDVVTDADVRAKRFRDAEWTLIFCNYNDPSQQMLRKRGRIADASVSGIRFTFACKSLSAAWETEVLDVVSPLCRYRRLGEGGCPFDMEGTTTDGLPARITATVASVTSQREIVLSEPVTGANSASLDFSEFPVGRFTKGLLTFTSGGNAGLEPMDIQEHKTGNAIELMFRMPFLIEVGDEVEMDVGCDRRFTTCCDLFDVAWAFGGEPDTPTVEQVSAAHL